DLLDECVQLGEIGYRLQGMAGVLAGGLAQDAEESAAIGQGAPAGGRHAAHDVGARSGEGADTAIAASARVVMTVGAGMQCGEPGAAGCGVPAGPSAAAIGPLAAGITGRLSPGRSST